MIKEYLEQAILLELNMAKLYAQFSNINNNDKEFWYKISLEESEHASLLQNVLNSIDLIEHNFDINQSELDELYETNNKLNDLIKIDYNTPRKELFKTALNLEKTLGEIHYHKLINSDVDDEIIKIFIKLNNDDNMHVKRIHEYIKNNNL